MRSSELHRNFLIVGWGVPNFGLEDAFLYKPYLCLLFLLVATGDFSVSSLDG